MKQRIITAIIGLTIMIPVLLYSDTPVLPVAVGLFAAIGVGEMLKCLGFFKKLSVSIPAIAIAGLLPICERMVVEYAGKVSFFVSTVAVTMLLYAYYVFCLAVVSKGKFTIHDATMVFAMVAYISSGFCSIVMLRDLPGGNWHYLLVFIGAWVSDGAAYFVGRAFGKHKLIPDVSPKKTVEGAIGGFIFCALSFGIYAVIRGAYSNIPLMLAAGVVVSFISQFGDLIMSLIKRNYGIKDYGNIFPGHGGVLDRFDSIIAIAPILYSIFSALPFLLD